MTKGKKPTTREMTPAKSAVTDIEALLAERHKYEDWIAALEAKKEQTPPHVFTRVHADYEQRLKAATDKLAAQSGSLGLEKSRIEKRIEELDLQIRHREDERSEIELRAHVGEMSEDDVAAAVEEADEELEKLNATRTTAQSDLGRISELLSSMSGGPRSTAPEEKSAPAKKVDELSFLQSVLGAESASPASETKGAPTRSSQPVSRPTAPSAPVQKEKPAPVPMEKEVKVEAKPAPPAAPPAPPRPSVSVEPAAPPQASVAPRVSAPVKTPEPSPVPAPAAEAAPPKPANPNDPMMFSPKTAGGVKNLKCKACGTMNDPRDWYCEKCGAELSVV